MRNASPFVRVDQEQLLHEAYGRMEAVYHLSQRFIEAQDEKEVIEAALRFMVTLTAAHGASYVPLDEYGQPYARLKYSETAEEEVSQWFQKLVAPEIKEQCRHCEQKGNFVVHQACPLISGGIAKSEAVFCLEVTRGERRYGVLNLYVQDMNRMDERSLAFVRTLVDEMALGLENLYMRRREMAASQQIRFLRQQTDLQTLSQEFLHHIGAYLEAEFIALRLTREGAYQLPLNLTWGEAPEEARLPCEKLLQAVLESGEAQGWDAATTRSAPAMLTHTAVASPLLSTSGDLLGALLVCRQQPATQRQELFPLVNLFSRQLALIIQNANMMRELESEVIFQERKNLAREIHDGLAQMLGLVKLQLAQLRMQFDKGDLNQAKALLEQCYQAISEAYLEARQTIDGLRRVTAECGLMEWLTQIVEEFEELTGLSVQVEVTEEANHIAPEVQAQLMRMVQEALSNVRKHAEATRVWIRCSSLEGEMRLEIGDNGKGFLPERVQPTWHHGLQGMRERAALIGAQLNIESAVDEGTRLEVRLPLSLRAPKEVVR